MSRSACALVTGASSGIGKCFARALAAGRHNLVLVARSRDKLEQLAEELRAAHGIEIEVLPVDLSDAQAPARIVAMLGERGLEVDLLVNSAGFGARGAFWELSLDRQMEML